MRLARNPSKAYWEYRYIVLARDALPSSNLIKSDLETYSSHLERTTLDAMLADVSDNVSRRAQKMFQAFSASPKLLRSTLSARTLSMWGGDLQVDPRPPHMLRRRWEFV